MTRERWQMLYWKIHGHLLPTGAVLAPQKGAGDAAGPNYVTVDRNLAMELVRVTEAAALAGGAWLGKVRTWHPSVAQPVMHVAMPFLSCKRMRVPWHVMLLVSDCWCITWPSRQPIVRHAWY